MTDFDPTEDQPKSDRMRADEARLATEAGRWRARSRRVQLYRRLLPILIVVLAGGALTWTVFRTVMSGVERNASESKEITLEKPMFHGQDSAGRSFVIGAEGAVRDPTTGRFRLNGPVLRLNLGGTKITELTADAGIYNETALTTPEAVVDTATGVVTGDKGVQGRGPLGTISATSYAIYEQGGRVVFRGSGDNKVQGTISPSSGG